ncbi:GTP pyrophosphokinase [Peptostreptococcus faecalis]|uniref:GTP pyrophosphokinase n=1 Tax=Peptostreptococcus faecalis TaxID=2045015 RepID=UPI000C7D28E5|nr:GTP pyrophosphokinase [Peptostreptococcus faecalis]
MSLKEFEFIEEATNILEEQRPTLEAIEDELVKFFGSMPMKENELIAVSSRIKSESSLKEKIIRNRYLMHYSDPEDLISDIPDLIGIRIECKFIKEEKDIFMEIKNFFDKTDDRKYFYSSLNKNIRLYMFDKQPLRQKNGFEIYKIDGEYTFLNRKIKFELQIKSLVNVFWSEIEHKIIYKNTTYLLQDNFLKDMMGSIKNNLTMVDDQLLNVYNNFKHVSKWDSTGGKEDIKKMFSKLLYDTITYKMEKELSFVIDFKKPCEIILNYSMNKYANSVEGLSDFLTEEYKKIANFINKDFGFNDELVLERKVEFEDSFLNNISSLFIEKMNIEVPWNLFFKILFELEPENNADDFSNFVEFYKGSLISIESLYNAVERFGEYSNIIIDDMYDCVYKMILKIGKIDIFYDYNIAKINKIVSEGLDYVCYEFDTYYDYIEQRKLISKTTVDSLIKIF